MSLTDGAGHYARDLETLRTMLDPLTVPCPRCPDAPAGVPCTARDWHGNPVTHDARRTSALHAYLAKQRGQSA